jgi:hypothetical protein
MAGALAWQQERRATAVVVPFRACAYHLKARALDAGSGFLGVHFLTPGELRQHLGRHLGLDARLPLRENLRLLLAVAAERVGDATVAAAPDHLLTAIDVLSAGGWRFDDAGPAPLRPVVREFERLVREAGFLPMHDGDRALLDRAQTAEPCFADLFITGFDAIHWPLWPLLRAAAISAENATVVLRNPRDEAHDLDAVWIGAWEEQVGQPSRLSGVAEAAGEQPSPLSALLLIPESKSAIADRANHPAPNVHFLVGETTLEQARAIVAKILHFLADPSCERLGVLFPCASALSRRVADILATAGVPHHDGLAHHAPGELEDPAFPAWIELQQSPRIPPLIRFLRALPRPELLFDGTSLDAIEDALDRAFGELLLDGLDVITAHLDDHPHRRDASAVAAGLRAIAFLPKRATIERFIDRTERIFLELEWPARAAELRRLAEDWRHARPLETSREAWLRWLGEALVSWRAVRAENGAHPYSRVQLLPAAQAESQAWTHLIVAGLNEGDWPPRLDESGFFGEEEIAALNRRVRTLNRRATTQGRHGEGHETVLPGKALVLGPAERRELLMRQFLNTIEAASVAVAATAQLFDESAPERRLNPSDFFTRLYFCARGRAISQETMSALRDETARWLAAAALWPESAPELSGVRQTRIAFDARRDGAQPFGEYEFALRAPPPILLRLSATDWETALKHPAFAWMEHFLGLAARGDDDETPWNLAIGTWVHAWLRLLGDSSLSPMPQPAQICARICEAAAAFRSHVAKILRRPLPDWWESAWQQALPIAEQLGARVGAVAGRTHLATEYTLPPDTAVQLAGGGQLFVRGRIDLILATAASIDDAWIVDYKTGNRTSLRPKKLAQGDGIQLTLYALALRQLGAREVGVSLLTPNLELDSPQLTLTDLDGFESLWRGLHRMQESGVFGAHGAMRDEFSFSSEYPLATLAVEPAILDEKWERSHPEFGGDDAQ